MNRKNAFNSLFVKKVVNFVFILGLVFGSLVRADQPKPSDDQKAEVYATYLQNLKFKANEQLSKTLGELRKLKDIVELNKAKKIAVEDQAKAYQQVCDFISALYEYQATSKISMTMDELYKVVLFNSSLISYLLEGMKVKFHNLAVFNIDEKVIQEDVSLEQKVEMLLMINMSQLLILNERVNDFSLSLSNKVIRVIDSGVVSPIRNYSKDVFLYGLLPSYFAYALYNGGPSDKVIVNDQVDASARWVFKALILGGIARRGQKLTEDLVDGEFTVWHERFAYAVNWLSEKRGGMYDNNDSSEKNVVFDEIQGNEKLKAKFSKAIDAFMYPSKYELPSLTYPLLLGGPGTGKSMFISAFLSELKKKYIEKRKELPIIVRINSNGGLISVGSFSFRVNQDPIGLIQDIKNRSKPAIFIIDEMHEVISTENKTLGGFLNLIGSVETSKDAPMLFIGATNNPGKLHRDLFRDGRFESFELQYPSFDSRLECVAKMIADFQYDPKKFNLKSLVRYTDGQSYETLKVIVRRAVEIASEKVEVFTQAHIDMSLREKLFKIDLAGKKIPASQKRIVSSHIASQALALSLLKADVGLSFVTIELVKPHYTQMKDKPQYGAVFTCQPKDTIGMQSKDEQLKLCQFHLAGFAGEKLLLGASGYKCHPEDKQKAFAIAQSIAYEGFDPAVMPKDLKDEKGKEAKNIIDTCQKQVERLLSSNKASLERIVEKLEKEGSLFDTDVASILK